MKRFKFKKKLIVKNYIFLIIIVIIIVTSILINTIIKSMSNNLLYVSKVIINNVNTNVVNNNIKVEILKKYQMNDLIITKFNDNEISYIDYNLENAYKILIDIKKAVIENTSKNMNYLYNYNYNVNENSLILDMPFYNYTNNLLLSNLGPKIRVKIGLAKLVDGSVKTKVTTYGINSLLVELYININITSSILIPSIPEESFVNNYDILITSKVIQGQIPSYYNGFFEQNSKKINA